MKENEELIEELQPMLTPLSSLPKRDFDNSWKAVVENFFPELIAFFLPAIYEEIDWVKGFIFLDKELIKIQKKGKVGKRLGDKMISVWDKAGQEKYVIIHIEVQNRSEPEFCHRMWTYFYRIFDRYQQSIYSVAILTDDNATWRPSTYQLNQWGCQNRFDFPIIKLLDYAPQCDNLEKSSNPIGLTVAAHLTALQAHGKPELTYAHKIRLTKKLYQAGYTFEQIRVLYEFIGGILVLPEVLEHQFIDEIHQFEEEENEMPYLKMIEERAIKKVTPMIEEQAIKKVTPKIREQGKIEGEMEGKRKLTTLILESKFGSLTPQQREQLQRMEIDALENLVKRIFTTTSLEELLQY